MFILWNQEKDRFHSALHCRAISLETMIFRDRGKRTELKLQNGIYCQQCKIHLFCVNDILFLKKTSKERSLDLAVSSFKFKRMHSDVDHIKQLMHVPAWGRDLDQFQTSSTTLWIRLQGCQVSRFSQKSPDFHIDFWLSVRYQILPFLTGLLLKKTGKIIL